MEYNYIYEGCKLCYFRASKLCYKGSYVDGEHIPTKGVDINESLKTNCNNIYRKLKIKNIKNGNS
jgi:hypothetical protein